jgi:hypothetical protein
MRHQHEPVRILLIKDGRVISEVVRQLLIQAGSKD